MSELTNEATPMEQAYVEIVGAPAPSSTRVPAPTAADPDGQIVAVAETSAVAERTASGVLAVLVLYISEKRLFEVANFKTMRAFAHARLGLSVAALKKKLRAGRAAQQLYPELCAAILEAARSGGDARPPTLPALPDETKLTHLRRAVKGADKSTRAKILAAATTKDAPSTRALVRMGKKETIVERAEVPSPGRIEQPGAMHVGASPATVTVYGAPVVDAGPEEHRASVAAAGRSFDQGTAKGRLSHLGDHRAARVLFLGRLIDLVIEDDCYTLRDLGSGAGQSGYVEVLRIADLTEALKALASAAAQGDIDAVAVLSQTIVSSYGPPSGVGDACFDA